MKRKGLTKLHVVGIVCAAAFVAAGSVWAIVAWSGGAGANPSSLPGELTVAALKKQGEEDPVKAAETIFRSFDQEDLTEEQRRELRRNAREVREAEMDKRVDEYFNASEEERQAVLDRQIDDMARFREQMRESWERRRAENEARRAEDGQQPNEEQARRERWRPMGGTAQERKERSEGRDPDKMARRISYFDAVRKRMQARGMEMPAGPGGFGGPGGPGRGPGPGGRP